MVGGEAWRSEASNGVMCYLCGKMPPYERAGERIYFLDVETRTVAMVCSDCIDATVRPAVLEKWRRSDGLEV